MNFKSVMDAFIKGLGFFKDWYIFQRLHRSPKMEKILFNLFGFGIVIAFFAIVIYFYSEMGYFELMSDFWNSH